MGSIGEVGGGASQDSNPLNMWVLTSNISPRRNTIATQDTMSAWFWMTNSWLSTGGFLLVFFRIPMSTLFGSTFFFFFLGGGGLAWRSRSCFSVAYLLLLILLLPVWHEDAQRSPLASYQRTARQRLNGVSLFCQWEGRAAAAGPTTLFYAQGRGADAALRRPLEVRSVTACALIMPVEVCSLTYLWQ